MDVPESTILERCRFWGRVVTGVSVVAFLVVLSLSFVFGLGINGASFLPLVSLVLLGLAGVFLGGFAVEVYSSVAIWLRGRSSTRTRGRGRRETPRGRFSGASIRRLIQRLRGERRSQRRSG